MKAQDEHYDVVVIGAGPSGSVASALLNKKGYRVLILEKEYFPRFSIGESLLPQCMTYLEQAGMLAAVEDAKFQFKNGAAFGRGDEYQFFDFREKFDKILADEAQKQGVEVRFGHSLCAFETVNKLGCLTVLGEDNLEYKLTTDFVLDASGFGRVLPKMLKLEKPSTLSDRSAIFTHIQDNIVCDTYDRNKILITVHPEHSEIWYWLIPFSNGRASLGVVIPQAQLDKMSGEPIDKLQQLVAQGGKLGEILAHANYDIDVKTLGSYSCDVTQLYGDNYALLGNAGEFLDPIFSSGVTIAMTSAGLAAETLDKQLSGQQPDWEICFSEPLKAGINTFKEFVEGWYDERFQTVVFSKHKNQNVTRMLSSILAGYAWDTKNPYVKSPARLTTLAELCRQ